MNKSANLVKATIYIFGDFANGYSQYPDNYTRDLFEMVSKSRLGSTEIIYHRDGALTYYIYTREISHERNSFIGLCYVFNGILITDLSYLFDIFEDAITNIVVQGELLEFTDEGNLSTKVNQLYTNTEELQRVSEYLNSKLSSLGQYATKLPPANFSIARTEWKNFVYEDVEDIQNAITTHSNVRVVKGENYDTESLVGYAAKLRNQNTKIVALTHENDEYKEEISKLQRQKKQFRWVIMLLVIILIGGIVFYYYAQNKKQVIQTKSDEIVNLNAEIVDKSDKIEYLNDCIWYLRRDTARLSRALTEKTSQYNEVKQKLSDLNYELNYNMTTAYQYFDSWRSTNYHQPSTTSSHTYTIVANKGDELRISYYVSSESSCDKLYVLCKRSGYSSQEMFSPKSGDESGAYTYVFPYADTYQITAKYVKDYSIDANRDHAGISDIYLYRPIINRLRDMSTY